MRNKRIVLFFIMIAFGVGLGLLYGWIINPIRQVNTSGDMLRDDYKADYVLMVAEIYAADGGLDEAIERLTFLGDLPPGQQVIQALSNARVLGYPSGDLDRLEHLSSALRAHPTPAGSGGQP